MSQKLRLAVLFSITFQGVLILIGRYRLSYDAYTHMLMADHYRLEWWSLWESRWYTGFEMTSYPPLVHQVIGLLAHLTGVEMAFSLVLLVVLAAYPLAMYCFARVFGGKTPAGYAALCAAFLPSLYLTAHTFGQLPTLAATLFALFSAAALAKFLRSGSHYAGALAICSSASMMSAHHATLLLLPWLMVSVFLRIFLGEQIHQRSLFLRMAVFSAFSILAGLLVIWPFWNWGIGQELQMPIDHPSRHNFFLDWRASLMFFWSAYGPLILVIPFALWKALDRRYRGLVAAFLALFCLGLGGTTPLPSILFGRQWEWLTYDRFSFWASLSLLPMCGATIIHVQRRMRQKIPLLQKRWVFPAFCSALAATSTLVSLFPSLLPTQPRPVEMQPVVNFLAQADRSQWRYLTFGFGDQFAYLNRLTKATTIDGSYHTARSLPELRNSGVGQIDTTYWLPNGLQKLDPILQKAGNHGVRWGFVNHPAYIQVLRKNAWQKIATLSNGIQVWENPSAALPLSTPRYVSDPLQSFSWGFLPLLALGLTAALAGLELWPAATQKALGKIHATSIGLLPVGLVLWYFRSLSNIVYERVYFTYDNALVFLSDFLAIVAVLAWMLARGVKQAHPGEGARRWPSASRHFWSIQTWLLALNLLITLSVLWSADWRVSLYFCLHNWLAFALYLSLRERPQAWLPAMLGFCAALFLQVFVGFLEFAAQSTAFLTPLGVNWPGVLDASTRGASVVQLADGTRWLRVYGTLPHPNILGSLLLVLLTGPLALALSDQRPRPWNILLFSLGLVLLVLTFSRAAWLGMTVVAGVIFIKLRRLNRSKLLVFALGGLIALTLTGVAVRSLIFTRVVGGQVPTEAFSIQARAWLVEQALELVRQHPLAGGGAGSFIIELAQRAPIGYIVEPVHNVPLLVMSELGIPGGLILAGFALAVLGTSRHAKHASTIILFAAVLGLCVTSLFDHFTWTLSPGRILFGLVLGLLEGQKRHDDA